MRKKVILITGIIFILITIPVATFLVKQNQDNRQEAEETTDASPTATPSATLTPTQGACTPPGATASVIVDFPLCDGTTCNVTQASCTWEAVSDAVTYTVTVNQVEDGTIVKNRESVPKETLMVSFPIVQNKTYKCSVEVVNACNASSPAVTDQLLCLADALVEEPSPTTPPAVTSTPTSTPVPTTAVAATPTMIMPPTSTPIPTNTPVPPIAQPGGTLQTMGIIGGILLFVAGGIFLLLL